MPAGGERRATERVAHFLGACEQVISLEQLGLLFGEHPVRAEGEQDERGNIHWLTASWGKQAKAQKNIFLKVYRFIATHSSQRVSKRNPNVCSSPMRLQSATAATALAARAVGRDGRDVLCVWGKKAVSNKCKERERESGTERVAFRRYHIFEISPPKIGKMSKTGINCFVIIATR